MMRMVSLYEEKETRVWPFPLPREDAKRRPQRAGGELNEPDWPGP